MTSDFRPALIIVDMQEDFCPPSGSLAVDSGRDIVAPLNELLSLRFVLKVATRDWHPPDHISFAANHPGKQPYVDSVTIVNPYNASESYSSQLWPVHCVQNSPGAELVSELDVAKVDKIIDKGTDPRVEMYSPFYDPFQHPRACDTRLAALLHEHAITDVYVGGLAGDYCVKCCAEDAAAKEGFRTYLVEECTRPVNSASWAECKKAIEASGAKVVGMDSDEVRRLYTMAPLTYTN
ncbi:isochorismatase [Xylaria sp. CBS 124048]|nr:isochorismatase [Xylaria sp. CBS 124048]